MIVMDDLSQLRTRLSTSLAISSRQWMRLSVMLLSGQAITPACAVPLVMIGRSGCGIHQVTLADQVGVAGPSMVRLLDRLCDDGLVRRAEDPRDRRAKTVLLTEAGQVLARQLEDRLSELRAEVFGALSADDLHAALRVQSALGEAIARMLPNASRTLRSKP